MKEYLKLLASGIVVFTSPSQTDWSVLDIDGIEVVDHAKRAGLQLADCTKSANFTALEPNQFGNTDPAYAYEFRNKLISDARGNTKQFGLTLVPGTHGANLGEAQQQFLTDCWGG